MIRSMIKEGRDDLDAIVTSISKLKKYQGKMMGKVSKRMNQRIGEVKKPLPFPKTELENCNKKVGDAELCGTLIAKYVGFYTNICTATPALCDDHPFTTHKVRPHREPAEPKKNTVLI